MSTLQGMRAVEIRFRHLLRIIDQISQKNAMNLLVPSILFLKLRKLSKQCLHGLQMISFVSQLPMQYAVYS